MSDNVYNLEVIKAQAVGEVKATLIFVHGVGHGAWCWERFMKYFSRRGYDCIALSLRGHAKSDGRDQLDTFTLDDFVVDVKRVVDDLDEKPILLGHSMGGAIVQKYIGDFQDTVRAAVLMASAPAGGVDDNVTKGYFERSYMGTMYTISILTGKKLSLQELGDASFFDGRIPKEEIEEYAPYLQGESVRAQEDLRLPFTQNYQLSIPIYIIGSKSDILFPECEQKKNGFAYHVEPVLLDGLCHDMMLDPEWEKPAQLIEQFLDLSI